MSQASSLSGLAKVIGYSLLKAEASFAQIENLCTGAREHGLFSVCVNGSWVMTARHLLENTDVKVACVVGFPLGAMTSDVKRFEAETAVDDGAQEIDVVLNIARLKAGDDKYVFRELVDVVEAADERTVKVILETCLLTDEEKVRACRLVVESGARFVKTSTGFSLAGANLAEVKLLRETVGPEFGVSAFGGIRDARSALAMFAAGATRLGISSDIALANNVAGGGTN